MNYLITSADLIKDRAKILALWKRNFPDLPEERYSWIYQNNPSGPAICWLALDTSSQSVVGSVALFPRRIFVNGKSVIAGIAGDYSVDKENRVFGPALQLQKRAICDYEGEGLDLIYGFPSKQSEAVHLRVGYKIVGEVRRLTKPLGSYYYLKKYFDIPVVTKAISKLTDTILKCMSRETFYRSKGEYVTGMQSSFDKRFDILWDMVKTRFAVIGERSSSFLNWRFVQCPHEEYRIFTLSDKESRDILGYVVFQMNENRVKIADLSFIDINQTIDSLLSEFIIFLRESGVDSVSISFVGNDFLMAKFREFGFSCRSSQGKVICYICNESLKDSLEENNENWLLFPGDSDI